MMKNQQDAQKTVFGGNLLRKKRGVVHRLTEKSEKISRRKI